MFSSFLCEKISGGFLMDGSVFNSQMPKVELLGDDYSIFRASKFNTDQMKVQ